MAKSAKKAFLEIADQDLSCYLDSCSLDKSTDTIEVTTFCNDAKKYIEGLEDGTISCSGNWSKDWQDKIDAIKASIKSEGTATFKYRPVNKVGLVEFGGECIITSYAINGDVAGKVEASLSLQISDEVSVEEITE